MLNKRAAVLLIIFLTGAALYAGSVAAAPGKDVMMSVTTAKRMIVNHNIQQAKQKAVSDALGVALQNAFASLVSRPVFASNLDFFYDQILPKTKDYVVTYRVLGGMENKGYYLVGVESKVNLQALEKTMVQARILNMEKDRPTLVFFISEKMPQDILPRYWWGNNPIPYRSDAEDVLVAQMIQDRYPVIGYAGERPDPAFYNITFNSIYDVEAARKLGQALKADMIVLGKAVSAEAINRMGEEKTFNARIILDVYHLETGEKVFSSETQNAVMSMDAAEGTVQALTLAAESAANDLKTKISEYWQQNLRKEHHFDLRVEGDRFLRRFITLKKKMKQMPGIENMQPREVGSNAAVMELFYKGSPSQFADTLMLKTFDEFGLEILEVTDAHVAIRFIEKDAALSPGEAPGIQVAPLENQQGETQQLDRNWPAGQN